MFSELLRHIEDYILLAENNYFISEKITKKDHLLKQGDVYNYLNHH